MARASVKFGVFAVAVLLLISVGDIDARKTSRRGGSSGSSGFSSKSSKSKPVPQPAPSSTSHGSGSSSSYGWNANANQPKASAPSEHAVKNTATNVQSGYNPSGGYNNRPANAPPPYSPSGTYNGGSHYGGGPPAYGSSSNYGGHHAPPPYGSQNGYGGVHAPPPYGSQGGYHGTPYGSYPGAASHGFSSSPGQGYNPSYGHSPSFGSQAPQTVIMQSGGSRPGIGQLAKEAFVYAGVSAGVNAAVNRLLPGGIYGHSMGSSHSGVVPPVSHTQITYNNYYNNGTAVEGQPGGGAAVVAPAAAIPASGPVPGAPATAPGAATPNAAAPAPAPANAEPQPPPEQQQQLGPAVTNEELKKFTDELFSKDTNNAMKYITMNLQGQKTDDSVTDDAPDNLLYVKSEAYEIPTVKAVLALHDNYELDVKTKETVTSEERKEESDLIDAFVATDVMKSTMKFLASKGLVPDDEYEFKDTLKRMWFSQFKRMEGEPSSSGFETIFLAERFDNEIIGLHNWIYFAKQEEARNLNYLGYIKKLEFSSVGAIVKGRSKLNDIVQPITSIFIGTSPELEMALYTLCFYARPNDVCPITVGGEDFLIVANRVNYFGKDIIISAFPDI